jgi:hypothetical protein
MIRGIVLAGMMMAMGAMLISMTVDVTNTTFDIVGIGGVNQEELTGQVPDINDTQAVEGYLQNYFDLVNQTVYNLGNSSKFEEDWNSYKE